MSLDAYLLAKYDVVVRQLDKLNEAEEKKPLHIAKARGYLLCLQDTLDALRSQPAPAPSRTPSQPRQPRTLVGGLLGSRAKAIAEDVMDAMEAPPPDQGGGQ